MQVLQLSLYENGFDNLVLNAQKTSPKFLGLSTSFSPSFLRITATQDTESARISDGVEFVLEHTLAHHLRDQAEDIRHNVSAFLNQAFGQHYQRSKRIKVLLNSTLQRHSHLGSHTSEFATYLTMALLYAFSYFHHMPVPIEKILAFLGNHFDFDQKKQFIQEYFSSNLTLFEGQDDYKVIPIHQPNFVALVFADDIGLSGEVSSPRCSSVSEFDEILQLASVNGWTDASRNLFLRMSRDYAKAILTGNDRISNLILDTIEKNSWGFACKAKSKKFGFLIPNNERPETIGSAIKELQKLNLKHYFAYLGSRCWNQ